MRNGVCYNPADLLPVVRTFPAGHEKAGQPMRWRARCPACAIELAGAGESSEVSRESSAEECHAFAIYRIAPILAVRDLIQTEADERWLAMLTPGQRTAFLAAFPAKRFPVECPRHARRSMELGQRRVAEATYFPEDKVVGSIRPMSEDEAFGEFSGPAAS